LPGKKSIPYRSQRGQAAVVVMLFMVILVVSGLGLFKAGKLTSNKMQLQNAADAAAYSMSTVEARDLNFAAYMNRAIVANEVAIGQLVGLASWAYHFKSFADYIDSYNQLFLSPLTLGASNAFITPITSVWRTVGGTAVTVMKNIAKYGTLVIHNINKIYGYAEFGYHTVSVIFAVGVLDEMIDQNGPPGTKISDFGIVALIAHIATYGVLPDLPGDQFATAYLSTSKIDVDDFGEQDSGYARLSALIRDSRDPFTMARGWELRPPGFPLDIDVSESIKISIGVASVEFGFDFYLYFDLSLERKGASELRIVLPDSGEIKAGQHFNWSSADTTGLFVDLIIQLTLWAEACVGVSPLEVCGGTSIGGGFEFGDSRAKLELYILGDTIEILDIPFPTSAPFASGFAEVGKSDPNNLGTDDMNLASLGGAIEIEHYGEAANNMLAWISPGPSVPTPIGIMASAEVYEALLGSRVNTSYAGLPFYVDTTGNESFMGVGAPNLLIGLVQDEGDYNTYYTYDNADKSVRASAAEPGGRFSLNEALADQELAVLAKSELYFSRPTDSLASHFHRGDGQAEYGSAFNPYWQARLIETTYADRLLALLIQQKEDFINLGQSFNLVFGDLLDYLPL